MSPISSPRPPSRSASRTMMSRRNSRAARARLNSITLAQVIRSPSFTAEFSSLLSDTFELSAEWEGQKKSLADTLELSIQSNIHPIRRAKSHFSPLKHIKSLFHSHSQRASGSPKLQNGPPCLVLSHEVTAAFSATVADALKAPERRPFDDLPILSPDNTPSKAEAVSVPIPKRSSDIFDSQSSMHFSLRTPSTSHVSADSCASAPATSRPSLDAAFSSPAISESSCYSSPACSRLVLPTPPVEEELDPDPFAKGNVQIVRKSQASCASSASSAHTRSPSRTSRLSTQTDPGTPTKSSHRTRSDATSSPKSSSKPRKRSKKSGSRNLPSLADLPSVPPCPSPLTPPMTPTRTITVHSSSSSTLDTHTCPPSPTPSRRSRRLSNRPRILVPSESPSRVRPRPASPFPFSATMAEEPSRPISSKWWPDEDEERAKVREPVKLWRRIAS